MIIERSVSADKKLAQNEKKPSVGELESILPPSPGNLDFGQVCLLKDSPFRLIKVSE